MTTDLIEEEPKPFIVRTIYRDRIWNISLPLATIEEAREFRDFTLDIRARRAAEREAERKTPQHIEYRRAVLEAHGYDVDAPEPEKQMIICRIKYEEVE